MRCPNCKETLKDGARYCNKCATIFEEPMHEKVHVAKKEEDKEEDKEENKEEDKKETFIDFIWYIISFLSPLIGVIIYFSIRNKKRRIAKVCLIIAIISLLINLILFSIRF